MLAYVFWHWPRPDVLRAEYEDRLHAFHEKINARAPAGMRGSVVCRVDGARWLPTEHGYEDWYLLDNAAVLDVIEREAVSGEIGAAHDGVAGLAAGGSAGLYKLTGGTRESAVVRGGVALWFDKPYGVSYRALYSEIAAVKGAASAELWQRMLTLGPAPEFCLLQHEVTALPDGWAHVVVRRTPVWP